MLRSRAAAAPAVQHTIDIFYPPGPQQQTRRTLLQRANGTDRRTDTVPFHRPCAAYYTGSANNSLSNEQTQYRTHKTYVPTPANIVEQLMTISSRDVFSARFHRPWRRPSNKYNILSLIYSEFLSQTYSANHRRQITQRKKDSDRRPHGSSLASGLFVVDTRPPWSILPARLLRS